MRRALAVASLPLRVGSGAGARAPTSDQPPDDSSRRHSGVSATRVPLVFPETKTPGDFPITKSLDDPCDSCHAA